MAENELPEPESVKLFEGMAGGDSDSIPTYDVVIKIRRYNPEVSSEAYWDEFPLTMYRTDRVLDALHKIKWEVDGSVSFRRSCAHGICGSDAMRINGRNRLACKTLLKDLDLSKPITVEPIKGLPCEKDLIVDMEPFFQAYREIMPFFINDSNEPERERLQTIEDRARFDDTTKCILCAACTSSCPVFWTDGQYFGPSAIVNAHRFIFDSRDEVDGSVSFRRSCAHGICGSDAMRINGRNRLACKTLLKDLDLSKPITVEPIKGLPCEKDLIVDMEPFFQAYREIMPFFINDSNEPERERLQTIEDRARFDDTTKCILCAACTSSCPVFWTDGQYFGPSAIVNAHRFIFDSRDDAGDLRLEILNDKEGVWRCRTTFNCTEACPRGIQITKAIAEVKQAILSRSL